MHWDDLRVFLAVAEAGSLRRAARALRLGQPTVGRHLHPALVRVTPPVEELDADYWLLVHPDLRAVPRVRRVMDWMRAVFKDARPLLQGARPARRAP